MKKTLTMSLLALVSLMGIPSTEADTVLTGGGTFVEPVTSFKFAFRTLQNTDGNEMRVDSFSHSLNGSLNTSIDFTMAEGFADTVSIDGVSNISAQAPWVGADVAGTGMAVTTGQWQRAIDAFNPNSIVTPDVGDTMTANLRVAVGFAGDQNNLGTFGYGDSNFNPGDATPGPINIPFSVSSAGGVDTFTWDGLSINTTDDMYTHGQFVDLTIEVTRTGTDTYSYVSTLSYTMPTVIPEPGTGFMVAMLGLGLVTRRRR